MALRLAVWPATGRAARGTVLLLQGRADFIEKYFETVVELQARGYAVVTFDWRGQGGSQRLLTDPRKSHVGRFSDYGRDLDAVLDFMPAQGLPRPYLGFAHSMGAAVLLHGLAAAAPLDAAVLTAPMTAIAPGLRPPAAEALTRTCHALGFGSTCIPGPRAKGRVSPEWTPDNLLTSDAGRYLRSFEMVRAAPQFALGKPTIGWMRAAFEGMAAMRRPGFAEAIRTPVLMAAGDADRVTETASAVALARRLPAASSVVMEACGHEVLMERDPIRHAFWRAFDGFTADRGCR